MSCGELRRAVVSISDTHIRAWEEGRRDSPKDFEDLVGDILDSHAELVVLNGDILDQKAGEKEIDFFLSQVAILTAAGRQVVFVKGNNEDNLSVNKQNRLYVGLGDEKHKGRVHVLENEHVVLTLHDGTKISIVGTSAVLSPEEAKELAKFKLEHQPGELQRRTEEAFYPGYKNALDASKNSELPTLLVFHNPPLVGSYPEHFKTALGVIHPTKFEEALDPSTIFAIVSGHLHRGHLPGIFFYTTESGIPVFDVALPVAHGITVLDLPISLEAVPNAQQEITRQFESRS